MLTARRAAVRDGGGGPTEGQAAEALGPGDAALRGGLRLALAHALAEFVAGGPHLAGVAEQGVDLAVELAADVDEVVGLAAAGEEDGVDAVVTQAGVGVTGEVVRRAGHGEGGVERDEADGAVVAMVEAAVAVPGDEQLGLLLADDADEALAEFGRVLDEAVGPAQEDALGDAEAGRGGLLLGLAHAAQLPGPDGVVLAALVAAGDEAEGHAPAVVGEVGGRAAAGELDVVGVGHDDERAAGAVGGGGGAVGGGSRGGGRGGGGHRWQSIAVAGAAGAESGGVARGGAGRVALEQVLVHIDDLAGDDVPVELAHRGGGGGGEAGAQVVVGEQRFQPLGEGLRAAPRDQVPGLAVADGVLQAADAGGDDGRAAGQRLDRDEAEALVVRGDDADVGGAVVLRQRVAIDGVDEVDAIARALGHRERAEPRPFGGVDRVAADDDDVQGRFDVGEGGRADEDVDALEPLQPADEEGRGLGGEASARRAAARSWGGSAGRKRSRSTPPGTMLTQSACAP